jgi:hypothetical protein
MTEFFYVDRMRCTPVPRHRRWPFGLAALGILLAFRGATPGATSTVSTAAQLQSALTTAQANGEDDVINVLPGTYYLETTLTYIAPGSENKSLTVQGADEGALIRADTIESGAMRGMYIRTSGTVAHVTLDGLTVQGGLTTSTDTEQGKGAGLFAYLRYGDLTLQNCGIRQNKATELFNPVNAAGAYLRTDNEPGAITIRDCIFSNNYAKGVGGGAYITPGYGCAATLINNLFVTNSGSTQGGGVYIYMVSGILTLDNNTFTGNRTGFGSGGGGAYVRLYNDDCVVNLRNNVLWSNVADNGIGGDLFIEDDNGGNSIGATVIVSYTDLGDLDVQDGDHLTQINNMNADPLITSDFHLSGASPCVDEGTNLPWMSGATDMDGQPRVFNDVPDLGADETFLRGLAVSATSNVLTSWDAVDSAVCRLQYSTNLPMGGWADAGNPVTAASRRIFITDTNPAGDFRAYRLEWTRP